MKKVISILLVLCMSLSFMTGCGSTNGGVSGKNTEDSESDSVENDPVSDVEQALDEGDSEYSDIPDQKFKIGFAYADPSFGTDPYLAKMNMEYACEALGCELEFIGMTSFGPEDWVTAYENLIQAGVDAAVCLVVTGSIIEKFEEAGIYWSVGCYEIIDPDLIAMCKESKYFCGDICEDEVSNGYAMAESLYNAGSRNIAYVSSSAGTATPDNRVRGIEQFVSEQSDMNVVSSFRDDMSKWGEAVEQMLTSYPNLDGLIATDNTPAVGAPVYAMGLQEQVKYASCNLADDTQEQLNDGFMVYNAMGQSATFELACTLVYNGLTGYENIIPEDVFAAKRPYIILTNADDFDNFNTYLNSDIPAYTGDELKYLLGYYNPELTAEDLWNRLLEYNENYSLQDVMERHEGMSE